MKVQFSILLTLCIFLSSLSGKEYFTCISGNDKNPGTEQAPFKTIQKGVNSLQPGDTLTILPGIYRENVSWKFNGDSAKKTVVRAKYPGTVLLRGDSPVSGFKKVDGLRNCYSIPLEKEPEGVNECDTMTMYQQRNSLHSGEFIIYSSYFYDQAKKRLYIFPSDGSAPEQHKISVSNLPGCGFSVEPADPKGFVKNVELNGLAASGFFWKQASAHASAWGIMIKRAEHCIIRNCSSYMNAGGITLYEALRSRIDSCSSYRNGTTQHVSAGNIIIFYAKESVIENCTSFNSFTYGIRFYGTNHKNMISNSKSLGDYRGSIWIKPDDGTNKLVNTYSPGTVACQHTEHCVYRENDYDRSGKNGKTSLVMKKKSIHFSPDDFADPDNYDLRLPEGSSFKTGFSGGGNVAFIAPDGNDSNNGKSPKTPWKSLKNVSAGMTVYFLPGNYEGGLVLNQNDVMLSGRGQFAPAVISGGKNGLQIKGSNVTVRRLSFIGSAENGVLCDGKNITIDRCGFALLKNAIGTASSAEVSVKHSAFAVNVGKIFGSGDLKGTFIGNIVSGTTEFSSGIAVYNNAYAGKAFASDSAAVKFNPVFSDVEKGNFTLKNKMTEQAFDGLPFGPYFLLYEPKERSVEYLAPVQISSTTANIGWAISSSPARNMVYYRKKGDNKWAYEPDSAVDSPFHSVSLQNLTPGTEYQYYVRSTPEMVYSIGNRYLAPRKKTPKGVNSPVLSFKTPDSDRTAKIFHVAKNGNDENPGTQEKPFLTISRAAMMVQPGDTVLVHSGKYSESVFAANTGTKEKPITFRAAPGEEVWLDGNDRRFHRGFAMFGKNYLRFDGFRLKEYGTGFPNTSGSFVALNSKNIEISRILHDGRGPGYSPGIVNARGSEHIILRNSVCIGGMSGAAFVNCSGIIVENNVFKKNAIWHLLFFGRADQTIRFANNIVTDNTRDKTHEAILKVENLKSLTEENNLYFMRYPRSLRVIVDFMANGSKMGRKKVKLDEYYKLTGRNNRSLFANPGIKVLSTQLCWKSAAERNADRKKGRNFNIANNNAEDGRNPENFSQYRIWGFRDFFAPELYKTKKIGLNDAFFKDMFLKTVPAWDQR